MFFLACLCTHYLMEFSYDLARLWNTVVNKLGEVLQILEKHDIVHRGKTAM